MKPKLQKSQKLEASKNVLFFPNEEIVLSTLQFDK